MPSFSLRNPYTIIVGAMAVVLLGVTALLRMPVDVFPTIKIPAVVVATFYQGMPPLDMEDNITFRYERFFTLGSNIEHIESRSLSGVSIIKVFFQPGTQVETAAAQMGTLAMADLGIMPPGTLPPLVLQYDTSSMPVTLVTVSGRGFSETQLEDEARYNIRNQLATVQGASVPLPFGGKFRQVMAYVNPDALRARGLSVTDVVKALNNSNLILPAGDAKIGPLDYYIYSNSMVPTIRQLNRVPIKVGIGQAPVLMNDVGKVEDDAQIQYNKVLIDNQPSVYIPVLRQVGANTIGVVNGVKALLPKIFNLPAGIKLNTIFDESIYVRQAVETLEHEVVSGSVLASLMILLFIGSLRSTLAVFLSIPLSILAAAFGLYMHGSTINIMTLGGFALAVGRLVDDSVVVLENINRHIEKGVDSATAARVGAEEVTYAVLASTVTTCIVFFPVMFLFGVARYLFTALALAVVLSMSASYIVAMSVIPIYCARFLKPHEPQASEGTQLRFIAAFNRHYDRFNDWFASVLDSLLDHKALVLTVVTLTFLASQAVWRLVGTELFPETDSGTFVINFKAGAGTRIENTTELAQRIDRLVREIIPASDLDMTMTNIGLAPSISAIYSQNASEDSGFMEVQLKPKHRRSVFYYMERVKKLLPARIPEVQCFLSSGSIIDSVLNFGSIAPIDIQFRGPSFSDLFVTAYTAQRIVAALPDVSQTFIPQVANYPTLTIHVDRVKAGRLGITQKQVVTSVITALNSNLYVAPSVWIDYQNNNDYFLTVQYRQAASGFGSTESLMNVPVRNYLGEFGHAQSVLLRDVASLSMSRHPSEADHYNIQRVVDVLVSPRGADLGGVQAAVTKALAGLKLPPQVSVAYLGSVATMHKSFSSFRFGLFLAIVLVYLVGVAQGRSWLDPFIFLFSIPLGLIGVVLILWATNTTLNIESVMGIIVMIGIVHSNAILLIDFANERRHAGYSLRDAAIEAARIRMGPILMTTLATLAGLAPIAMVLEAGSEASAPLARTVIGGLAVSTVMTLVVVPMLWELFYSWKKPGETHVQQIPSP